jgi:uncharacterized protein
MSLIDPGLLKLLRCPETRLPVTEADATLVADLNQRVAAGTLKNGGGKAVTDKLDGALLRSDRAVVYPIRNRIPLMLVEEAIPLA